MTTAIHPGEILSEEFLGPLGLSASGLARSCNLPSATIIDIVEGRSGVTPEIAMGLARALGTTQAFWLNLQDDYQRAAPTSGHTPNTGR